MFKAIFGTFFLIAFAISIVSNLTWAIELLTQGWLYVVGAILLLLVTQSYFSNSSCKD